MLPENIKKNSSAWNPCWWTALGKYQSMIPSNAKTAFAMATWPLCEELNAHALKLKSTTFVDLPTFSPQIKLPRRRSARKEDSSKTSSTPKQGGYFEYDKQITLNNIVPTRSSNWHDFFNFIIWTSFSKSKYALHRLSFTVASDYIKNHSVNRSRINDLSTLFDEGGVALVISNKNLYQDLITQDILCLKDIPERQQNDIQCAIFGHALLESAYFGNYDINAFGLILQGEKCCDPKSDSDNDKYLRYFDAAICRFFSQSNIIAQEFKRTSFALKQLL